MSSEGLCQSVVPIAGALWHEHGDAESPSLGRGRCAGPWEGAGDSKTPSDSFGLAEVLPLKTQPLPFPLQTDPGMLQNH